MSWEAQAWAAKQKTGSSSSKLVLLGLASCADANHCAFPSVAWLSEFGDLDRKTVIAALQRLEAGMFPLIEDTGERKGRTKQVKVYRLASATVENASGDPASLTVPKAERSQKRNGSGSSGEQSRKRDTEPFSEPKPPFSSKDEKTPQDRKNRSKKGTRLPDDWEPPAIDDLSAVAVKLVRQWPSGAYQAVCEAFRLHYRTATRAAGIRDGWNDVLSKWLISDHAKIMKDAKAGVSFASLAPVVTSNRPAVAIPPVEAKQREDDMSSRVHDALRRRLGAMIYDQWLKPAAILFDEPGLTVIVGSEFVRGWIDDHYSQLIGNIAREAASRSISWVRVHTEAKTR
jgi:hypothetical protein